jgi:hypothetical protein
MLLGLLVIVQVMSLLEKPLPEMDIVSPSWPEAALRVIVGVDAGPEDVPITVNMALPELPRAVTMTV